MAGSLGASSSRQCPGSARCRGVVCRCRIGQRGVPKRERQRVHSVPNQGDVAVGIRERGIDQVL